MISDIWDELYFGAEVDPEPSRSQAELVAMTSPPRHPSQVGSNVNDLAIEDVEMFLEHVEAQRDRPLGEPASPPFYGRTTPMLYTDEQGNYWPENKVPFASYQPSGHTQGNDSAHNGSDLPQTLATADGSLSLTQCCGLVNDDKNSPLQQLNIIVPDFTLLTGAFSPVQSSEPQNPNSLAAQNTAVKAQTEPVWDAAGPKPHLPTADYDKPQVWDAGPHLSTADDSKPQVWDAGPDLSTADDSKPQVKTELRDVIKKRRKASGKEAIVIDWEENAQNKGQLTDRDIERRRRRRESNRRAAQKSRIKKREQNLHLAKDMDSLVRENTLLTEDVADLRAELAAMTAYVRQHLDVCPNPGNLASVLSPHR